MPKSVFLLILFILSVNRTTNGAATIRCPKDVSFCLDEITPVLNETQLAFAQSDEELDILCGLLNNTINCVTNYIASCISAEAHSRYQSMISGTLVLLDRLCSEGDQFRQKYLRHAKCFHNLADVFQNCTHEYLKAENERIKNTTIQSFEEQLHSWCCNNQNHRYCTKAAIIKNCGYDAAELADQILVISGSDVSLTFCTNITANSTICPPSLPITPETLPITEEVDQGGTGFIVCCNLFLLLPSFFATYGSRKLLSL